VATTALLASGCGGDPAPEPSAAPLEVALDGCSLNRPTVGAGSHQVAIVGQGRATLTDPAGGVVLTARGGEETPAELQMAAGTYTVTCEPEGGRLGEARLEVERAG
jgi:hypothetical protein